MALTRNSCRTALLLGILGLLAHHSLAQFCE